MAHSAMDDVASKATTAAIAVSGFCLGCCLCGDVERINLTDQLMRQARWRPMTDPLHVAPGIGGFRDQDAANGIALVRDHLWSQQEAISRKIVRAMRSGARNDNSDQRVCRSSDLTTPLPRAPRPATSTRHAFPEHRRTSRSDRRLGRNGPAQARVGRRGASAPLPPRAPVCRAHRKRRHKSRRDDSRPGAGRCRLRPPCVRRRPRRRPAEPRSSRSLE